MLKVMICIIGVIVVYLAVGAVISRIKLPVEDRKGIEGCASMVFGTIFWPVITLMVIVVKWKQRSNKK